MAKNLVERLPGGRLNAAERGYLFIAPHPKRSEDISYTTNPNADPKRFFGAANANYRTLLKRLGASVIGQSEFQDWAMAEKTNDKLHLLDRRAHQLQALFTAGQLTVADTKPASTALLRAFFTENGVMTPSSDASLNAARMQLKQQYSLEYGTFADANTADAWVDAVLVLELSAGLHEKEEMFIYDFTADPAKIAGSSFEAFGGFFDFSYRKHDYDYGRRVGQKQLASYASQRKGVFENLQWKPKPIDQIDHDLDNLQMSRIDRVKRQQLYQQMCDAC